jgi:hypothetical protein
MDDTKNNLVTQPRYQIGQNIQLMATDYWHGRYIDHGNVDATILSIVKSTDWKSPFVPEYVVQLEDSTQQNVPQFSIAGANFATVAKKRRKQKVLVAPQTVAETMNSECILLF